MKDLDDAMQQICDLKGSLMAADAFMAALIQVLPPDVLSQLQTVYKEEAEHLQTVLLNASTSEHTISGAERDIQRLSTRLQAQLDQFQLLEAARKEIRTQQHP